LVVSSLEETVLVSVSKCEDFQFVCFFFFQFLCVDLFWIGLETFNVLPGYLRSSDSYHFWNFLQCCKRTHCLQDTIFSSDIHAFFNTIVKIHILYMVQLQGRGGGGYGRWTSLSSAKKNALNCTPLDVFAGKNGMEKHLNNSLRYSWENATLPSSPVRICVSVQVSLKL